MLCISITDACCNVISSRGSPIESKVHTAVAEQYLVAPVSAVIDRRRGSRDFRPYAQVRRRRNDEADIADLTRVSAHAKELR